MTLSAAVRYIIGFNSHCPAIEILTIDDNFVTTIIHLGQDPIRGHIPLKYCMFIRTPDDRQRQKLQWS